MAVLELEERAIEADGDDTSPTLEDERQRIELAAFCEVLKHPRLPGAEAGPLLALRPVEDNRLAAEEGQDVLFDV